MRVTAAEPGPANVSKPQTCSRCNNVANAEREQPHARGQRLIARLLLRGDSRANHLVAVAGAKIRWIEPDEEIEEPGHASPLFSLGLARAMSTSWPS